MSLPIRRIWLGGGRVTAHRAGNGCHFHISVSHGVCVCVYERSRRTLLSSSASWHLSYRLVYLYHTTLLDIPMCGSSETQTLINATLCFCFYLLSLLHLSAITEIWAADFLNCRRWKRGKARAISTPLCGGLRWRLKWVWPTPTTSWISSWGKRVCIRSHAVGLPLKAKHVWQLCIIHIYCVM